MTYGKANALASYGRMAGAAANPLQQIVMLYDGAVKFLRLAAADIVAGDIIAKAEHSGRALDILGYLQSTLDMTRGGDVARHLDTLYAQVSAAVLHASARLDAEAMRRAADLLIPVRDAWAANANHTTDATAAAANTNANKVPASPALAPAITITPATTGYGLGIGRPAR